MFQFEHAGNSSAVESASIVMDETNPWSTNTGVTGFCGGDPSKYDVQNVLTHEFGHWVGAKHAPLTDAAKHRPSRLLASTAAITQAVNEPANWRLVGRVDLRGTGPTEVYEPV